MNVSVTASMNADVVQRIRGFQEKAGIKYFVDAVEAYIQHLEEKAYPKQILVSKQTIR